MQYALLVQVAQPQQHLGVRGLGVGLWRALLVQVAQPQQHLGVMGLGVGVGVGTDYFQRTSRT